MLLKLILNNYFLAKFASSIINRCQFRNISMTSKTNANPDNSEKVLTIDTINPNVITMVNSLLF